MSPQKTPRPQTQRGELTAELPRRRYRFKPRQRIDVSLVMLDVVAIVITDLLLVRPISSTLIDAVIFVVVLELTGKYRPRFNLSSLTEAPGLVAACIIAAFSSAVVFERDTQVGEMFVHAVAMVGVLLVVRLFYFAVQRRRRRRNADARSRTVIIGGGIVASKILESVVDYPELGVEPIAIIGSDPMAGPTTFGVPVVSDIPIRTFVEQHQIETVIVAFRNAPDSSLVSPLRECDGLDCEIFIVPRLFEFVHLSTDMDRIHTIPLTCVRRNTARTWYWPLKRVFDVAVSASALLVLSPLLAVTALAVKASDRHAPIVFRQHRIGRNGAQFTLYKFRSMRPAPPADSDTSWNAQRSSRVSTVGKIIRKTSIDELPQLWNVVKGDMSLVGPRPERPHFVQQFEDSVPSYRDRHRMKAGLTGWAAIHGLRGDTSIDDRAMYDNFYIENWSVWLDIRIIILTVGAVIRGTGS